MRDDDQEQGRLLIQKTLFISMQMIPIKMSLAKDDKADKKWCAQLEHEEFRQDSRRRGGGGRQQF